MASFFSARSVLLLAFALGAGCGSSSSSDAPASPAGTGGSPDGGATTAAASPIAVVLPPPDDRALAAADQAHVIALAARPEGGVFAIVMRRDGMGAFQPAGGPEGLADVFALVAVDGTGAVSWKQPVARGARVMAMPDGSAVVGDVEKFRQFDASGKLVRETATGATVFGVARLGSSTIAGLVLLTKEAAPRFGLATQTLALVDAFGAKALASSFGDADYSPLATDGAGVGWSSSHRIAPDGSLRRLGIPRWERVVGRRDGGAYVTFTVASDGCGTPCEPEVAKRGEGAFRAQLDADGKLVSIEEDVLLEDILAEHEGVLWFANGRVRGAAHALQVGPIGAWGSASSTEQVAPGAIASGKDGVWVGGGFTGRLRVLGTDLEAGKTQGTPFLVRIPSAASLGDLGG